MSALTPSHLRTLREQRILEIDWPDQRTDRLTYFDLRCACPCAVCVDEVSGRQILQREQVSPDVDLKGVGFVGNYALRMEWSDGHSTGIFTWERLRHLGETVR